MAPPLSESEIRPDPPPATARPPVGTESGTRRRRLRWLGALTLTATAAFALAAIVGTLRYGFPDNGDFRKYNGHLVRGPAGVTSPPLRTPEQWRDAFGKRRWHRYWEPRETGTRPATPPYPGTASWIWLPGVLLHRLFGSAETLDLVDLGWGARLFVFASALALATAVALDAIRRGSPWPLLAALPWTLLATASWMSRYYNSFFREAATLTYGLALAAALALAPRLRTGLAVAAVLATGALFACSAPTHGPAALIVALAALDVARAGARSRPPRAAAAVALVAAVSVTLAAGGWIVSTIRNREVNSFNALFLGVLPLSDDPGRHLEALGLPPETVELVGRSAFEPAARRFRARHGEFREHGRVLGLLLREPRLLWRVPVRAGKLMNWTSLAGFDLFAEDDPAPPGTPGWNLWGELQARWFPRGTAYLGFVVVALAAGFAARASADPQIAATGRLCAVGAAISALELAVKFAGDGPTEPLRHLAAANLFFGVAVASGLWLGLLIWARRRSFPRDGLAATP